MGAGRASTFEWLDIILGTQSGRQGHIYDDDFVDRLNNLYTTILLFMFAILISTRQYVGEPITCWCPAEFESEVQERKDNRVDYANYFCWVSNTYYIPMKDQIPADAPQRMQTELTYYQWVPLILLSMAVMFKIPRIVWTVLSAYSGISIGKLGGLTRATQLFPDEDRTQKIKFVAEYLNQWLESVQQHRAGACIRARQRVSDICCLLCGRHYGNYIVTCVLVVKTLYLANAVGQLYLLNEFLGIKYSIYGYELMKSFADGEDFTSSPRFPRVTLCDFQIRQLANLQRWTVQCVLPINIFNEKIFIFIWFWLVLLSFLTAMSLFVSLYGSLFPQHRKSYVRKYLSLNKNYNKDEKPIIRKFVNNYLRQDGCYILRVFSNNASDVISADIIQNLYEMYKEKQNPKLEFSFGNTDANENVSYTRKVTFS